MKKYLLSVLSIFMMVNTFAQTCAQQYPNIDFNLIEDCNGNCIPAGWSGDNACDDGSFMYNISEEAYCQNFNPDGDYYCDYIADLSGYVTIYLNCEEANYDDGDCEPIPGCTDPEACNFNSNNATIEDGSCIYEGCTCEDYNLSLNVITTEDCNGNCAPASWIGDDDCDDNNYMFNVEEGTYCQTIDSNEDGYCENIDDLSDFVLISFFCEETSYDEGDCQSLNLIDLSSKPSKKLIKTIDVLGRDVESIENGKVIFKIYNDGTSKKVINLNN